MAFTVKVLDTLETVNVKSLDDKGLLTNAKHLREATFSPDFIKLHSVDPLMRRLIVQIRRYNDELMARGL